MSAPNGSVSSQSGGWLGPPTLGRHKLVVVGRGCGGDMPPTTSDLKQGECHGCGGGGGGLQRMLGHHRGGGGGREGTMGVGVTGKDGTNTLEASPGGGGGRMGQTPWRHPRWGGGGGRMGQTPWRHPRGGGGWDKHPGATPLPHPDTECESCRGKGEGG